MKRFVMLFAILAAVAAAAPAWAQSKDLAGSWVLDPEKTGNSDGPKLVVITLTAAEFTARMGSETAPAMAFKLDGTETTLKNGGKTKAAWRGDKLDATVTNERGPETVTFSREGAWLVVESTRGARGPMKLYFKKGPAEF
jgi:hypothetical protein